MKASLPTFVRRRWAKALIALLFLLPLPALAQVAALSIQTCVQGATQASVSGIKSSNFLQGVVPYCSVTVYLSGTTTKALIYSDTHNTALPNPFAASSLGQFLVYAATAQAYDVTLSGGIPPNAYSFPITFTGIFAGQNIQPGTVCSPNVLTAGCTGGTDQPSAFNSIVAPGGTMTGPLNGTTANFSNGMIAPIIDNGGQTFDVRAYGAKCDGSTDDSAAFAATKAAAGVGGTIYVPARTCVARLTMDIAWQTLSIAKNGTIKQPSYTAFTVTIAADYVTIKGEGIIDGGWTQTLTDGIFMGSFTGWTMAVAGPVTGQPIAVGQTAIASGVGVSGAGTVVSGSGTSWIIGTGQTVTSETLTLTNVASFTGSISGTTLTVTGPVVGSPIAAGMVLTGSGVAGGTTVVSGSGTSWLLSASATVTNAALVATDPTTAVTFTGSISGTTMTVPGGVSGGAIAVGMTVNGTNVLPQTHVAAGSGTSWTVVAGVNTTATGPMYTANFATNLGCTVPALLCGAVGIPSGAGAAPGPAYVTIEGVTLQNSAYYNLFANDTPHLTVQNTRAFNAGFHSYHQGITKPPADGTDSITGIRVVNNYSDTTGNTRITKDAYQFFGWQNPSTGNYYYSDGFVFAGNVSILSTASLGDRNEFSWLRNAALTGNTSHNGRFAISINASVGISVTGNTAYGVSETCYEDIANINSTWAGDDCSGGTARVIGGGIWQVDGTASVNSTYTGIVSGNTPGHSIIESYWSVNPTISNISGQAATGTIAGSGHASCVALQFSTGGSVNNLNCDGSLGGGQSGIYLYNSSNVSVSNSAISNVSIGAMQITSNSQAPGTAPSAAGGTLDSSKNPALRVGSLPSNTTFYVKVVAICPGVNYVTAEGSVTTLIMTGSFGLINWGWAPIPCANSYRLYVGLTPGGENSYFATRYHLFQQLVAVGTSGTPSDLSPVAAPLQVNNISISDVKLNNATAVIAPSYASGGSGGSNITTHHITNTLTLARYPDYLDFTGNVIEAWGDGSPQGVLTAAVGSIYHQLDGTAQQWAKSSGTGNIGWTAPANFGSIPNCPVVGSDPSGNAICSTAPTLTGVYANFGASAIPVILGPNGSVDVNGILTFSTPLGNTFPNAWIYLPANAIGAPTAGAAGVYYATCTSTTSCQIYTNYSNPSAASFVPSIPASPVHATAGSIPSYTQTLSVDIILTNTVIPGGSLGNNGILRKTILFALSPSTNNRVINFGWQSGLLVGATITTNSMSVRAEIDFANAGTQATQTAFGSFGSYGVASGGILTGTVDTSVNQSAVSKCRITTATDYCIVVQNQDAVLLKP